MRTRLAAVFGLALALGGGMTACEESTPSADGVDASSASFDGSSSGFDGGGATESGTLSGEDASDSAPPPAGDHLFLMHASSAGPATIDLCMKPASAVAFTDPPVLKAQGKKAVPFKGMSAPIDAPAYAKEGSVSLRIIDANADCNTESVFGTIASESFFINRLLIASKPATGPGPTTAFTAPGYGGTGVDTLTYEKVEDSVDLSFEPDLDPPSTPLSGSPTMLSAGVSGKLKSTAGERPYKASNGGRTFSVAFGDGSIMVCDIAIALVDGLTDCSANLHEP